MRTHARLLALLLATLGLATAADAPTPAAAERVLFVLTSHDRKGDRPSGCWLAEVTHPHRVFAAAGWRVDSVSPQGGAAPVDPESMDLADADNAAFWNDPERRALIERTRGPDAVRAEDYAAIFVAGGHGAMWDLPRDARIARLIAAVHDRGGIVGAVCHGPAALTEVRLADGAFLVAGREVAAFTNEEERLAKLDAVVPFLLADRLAERGAKLVAAPPWQAKVAVSGRLVTGQNPASAAGVAEAMLAARRAPAR